jgi:chaperonin GroES
MLNFKRYVPFANRVLIKRAEAVTKTRGGILLPEQAKTEVQQGEVISTGPGLTLNNGILRETQVKTGQTVLLPMYAGVKVTFADK